MRFSSLLCLVPLLAGVYGCSGTEFVIANCGPGTELGPGGECVPVSDGGADASADTIRSDATPVDGTPVDSGVETGPADTGPTCPPGAKTSISGTVYMPDGKTPLFNTMVFVPTIPLPPLTKGAKCARCAEPPPGKPSVITLTDALGKFKLDDVPVGSVPVVFQTGKWRRAIKIDTVACKDTPIVDPNLSRMPKNRTEGDMPRIAVVTGGCDKIACILPKVGIDPAEMGIDGEDKAVHLYQGSGGLGPAGMKSAPALWDSADKLKEYDVVVTSCECYEATTNKTSTSFAAMRDYLDSGGRLLSNDFQYLWYKSSPDAAMAAMSTIVGGAPFGENPITLDTSIPKVASLSTWLSGVVSGSTPGKLTCDYVFANFTSTDKTKATVWGSSTAAAAITPRFVSVTTPVGKEACGKAVHVDAHVNQADTVDTTFPAGCKSAASAGQLAMAFVLFDLSGCVQDDKLAPVAPKL